MSFYMQERFGAWQVDSDPNKGQVEFKIFFPDNGVDPSQYEKSGKPTDYGDPQITSIQVIGDFQEKLGQTAWDTTAAPQMTKSSHAKGVVWSYITPVELTAGLTGRQVA